MELKLLIVSVWNDSEYVIVPHLSDLILREKKSSWRLMILSKSELVTLNTRVVYLKFILECHKKRISSYSQLVHKLEATPPSPIVEFWFKLQSQERQVRADGENRMSS